MEGGSKNRRQSRENQKSGGKGDDHADHAKESSHSRSEHKLKRKASQEGSGETSSASKKRHAYDSGRGTESDEMTDSQIPQTSSQQTAVETQA